MGTHWSIRLAALGFLVLLSTASALRAQPPAQLALVRGGKSVYTIVIPRSPTEVERSAATVLQQYLLKISNALLPIKKDTIRPSAFEILIGNARSRNDKTPEAGSLDPDGILIRTNDQTLILRGGSGKGTLYAVYTLLEDYLGCRKYKPTVEVIPHNATVTLPFIDRRYSPPFTFRSTYYHGWTDRAFTDWHKLISVDDQRQQWGMWVHTFDRLVPAKEFFPQHPEYYSLIGGHRVPSGQLCLSNSDVERILTERLGDMIKENPNAKYWSVSQNDNFNECQCDSCNALKVKYGGSSGVVINFVNNVAAHFPDKIISTLAYQYTRSAPTGVKPAPNVNIMFCSIECNRSEPIPTDPRSASFRKDLEDWHTLTSNILVWDYVVQFRNLLDPFPNLGVLQPNLQYFARNGVKMMFEQGCNELAGEFCELRTYVIAKLLWNPNINVSAVMNDFLNGYYGSAGRYLRQYIDTMHDALARSGKTLDIYGYPYDAIDSYLTPHLLHVYTGLFEKAEAAVQSQPEFLERVKIARLPLEYAILDISLHDPTPELSYFDKHGADWSVRPAMRKKLDAFVSLAKKAGVTNLEEHGTSPDEYKASVEQLLHVSVTGNLAFGKPVTLLTTPTDKYPVGGGSALTNGFHGSNDYHVNWLGFEASDMDAIIDLQSEKTIQSVNAGFLQYWYAWIWLPTKVDFSISRDGKNFTSVSNIPDDVPDTTSGAFTRSFDARFSPVKARYVRVHAFSRLTCPDWHIGAGQKSWIFCDEIVVQ